MARRKLLSFTDTKKEIDKRKKQFSKLGYTNLLVKKQFGAYSLLGKKEKK